MILLIVGVHVVGSKGYQIWFRSDGRNGQLRPGGTVACLELTVRSTASLAMWAGTDFDRQVGIRGFPRIITLFRYSLTMRGL